MTPKLYSYKESGNSYKVHLLAALLHIDLEIIELDFLNDQQHSPEFLAINPRGEVLTLVDGEKTFTDSAAILVPRRDAPQCIRQWKYTVLVLVRRRRGAGIHYRLACVRGLVGPVRRLHRTRHTVFQGDIQWPRHGVDGADLQ
jgi:hypothetical protein